MTGGSRSLTSYLSAKRRETIGGNWVAPAPTSERSPVDDLGLANRHERTSRRLKAYLSPLDFGMPMGALKLHTRVVHQALSTHATRPCAAGLVAPCAALGPQRVQTDFCKSRFGFQRWAPVPCETTATVPKAAWPAVRRRSHPVARASAGSFVPCVSPHRLESRTSGAPSRQSFGTLKRPFDVVIGSSL